jgi:hypothetical protein
VAPDAGRAGLARLATAARQWLAPSPLDAGDDAATVAAAATPSDPLTGAAARPWTGALPVWIFPAGLADADDTWNLVAGPMAAVRWGVERALWRAVVAGGEALLATIQAVRARGAPEGGELPVGADAPLSADAQAAALDAATSAVEAANAAAVAAVAAVTEAVDASVAAASTAMPAAPATAALALGSWIGEGSVVLTVLLTLTSHAAQALQSKPAGKKAAGKKAAGKKAAGEAAAAASAAAPAAAPAPEAPLLTALAAWLTSMTSSTSALATALSALRGALAGVVARVPASLADSAALTPSTAVAAWIEACVGESVGPETVDAPPSALGTSLPAWLCAQWVDQWATTAEWAHEAERTVRSRAAWWHTDA